MKSKNTKISQETNSNEPLHKEIRLLHHIRVFLLCFSAILAVAVISVYMIHLLFPWGWLPADKLDRIGNFAISIIIGLLTSGVTTYYFSKKTGIKA